MAGTFEDRLGPVVTTISVGSRESILNAHVDEGRDLGKARRMRVRHRTMELLVWMRVLSIPVMLLCV